MVLQKRKVGRPIATKTLLTQLIRERIVQKVAEYLDPIIDAQVQAAIKESNTNAARFLIEHSVGKPKETVEHQGGMGLVALVAELEKGDQEEAL